MQKDKYREFSNGRSSNMDKTIKARIIVFSQNVIIKSIISSFSSGLYNQNVFITTQMLLENEKSLLMEHFEGCIFLKYADLLSDSDNENCDGMNGRRMPPSQPLYYHYIKELKNDLVVKRVKQVFTNFDGFVLSDDLGIYSMSWIKSGFKRIGVDYYFNNRENMSCIVLKHMLRHMPLLWSFKQKTLDLLKKQYEVSQNEVNVSYVDGRKLVFIGRMDRVAYRLNNSWEKSTEEWEKLRRNIFETKDTCTYLSTLHESWKCKVPDSYKYDVRYIQDGYLPSNYSSAYLSYKPKNVKYYTWDSMGKLIFEKYKLPVSVMPFRKKLYLPKPEFKDRIKKILVATSGPGDWTAQKNRSDEDLMVDAFVKVARNNPDLEIVYRCHPTWVHPEHNGVNSINRIKKYIEYSGVKNIRISSNIPQENLDDFILSFPRSSLEEDLIDTDFVFGEHSISLIDAALKKIPFSTVNLTNRRDLACDFTRLGFCHCESIEDILELIKDYRKKETRESIYKAIDNYNNMTSENN